MQEGRHTTDALAVYSVDVLKAANNVMLDTEGDSDLVVGSLLEYKGVVLHVGQFLLAIKGVYDVSFRTILKYHPHLLNNHFTWVV